MTTPIMTRCGISHLHSAFSLGICMLHVSFLPTDTSAHVHFCMASSRSRPFIFHSASRVPSCHNCFIARLDEMTDKLFERLRGTDTTATLVAGGVTTLLAYLVLTRLSSAAPKTLENLPSQPRKIHSLATSHLLLGDLLTQISNGERMYDWITHHSECFGGEPWKFKIPGQEDVVVLTTPKAVEEVMATQFDAFPKGRYHIDLLQDMFGIGVLASDGPFWYHQRKTAVKFFTAKTLRTMMMVTMQKNMEAVYGVLDCAILGLHSSKPVDLKQLFLEFTMDTFAELGMGADLRCIGATKPHPFQHALDTIAPITARRFRMPAWLWRAERWLKIGPEGELAKQKTIVYDWLRATIAQSLEKVMAKRHEGLSEDADDVKSIVELFVEHEQTESELDPEELVDFMLTFVIAARDTTAETLSYFFYSLGKHPEVRERIRLEMGAKLPQETEAVIPFLTAEHIKSLVYLEATIKEVLRLYPAVPCTLREVGRDVVICDDIVLRKNQLVMLSQYAMARNTRVWGPDAASFKPERWIDPVTGQIVQEPLHKFFTFSAGPRTCVGMGLGMLELRIVTANLLYRYDLHIDPGNDGSYVVSPTNYMKHPLMAMVTSLR